MIAVEARLSELTALWEELRRQGQAVSAEDLCSDCPELVDDLKRRIETRVLDTPGPAEGPGAAGPAAPASPSFDDFEVLGELGHGGMGVVYRAWDKKRGELVALKTMQRVGPSALARFKQEFRALADVAHPNLVTFHELFSDGRTWFFSMELVEGANFLDYVRDGSGTPDGLAEATLLGAPTLMPGASAPRLGATALSITLSTAGVGRLRGALGPLAAGIAALHAAGKLHRDIKPSNVLVTRQGRVVVLDFGLVADLGPASAKQSTESRGGGTIAYMAPEQAAGRPIAPACDWYGLGVMLYEALTGRLPYVGSAHDVLRDKQRFDPPAPSVLTPSVPADLDALCVELLRRDPGARPTGPEVLRRLGVDAAEAGRALPARSAPTATMPLIGRERHLAALASAYSALTAGRTRALFIQGRSGAGKSALVQHFLDDLTARDAAVVLMGRCYERESVPYKALDSLVDALGRYLRRLPNAEAQALLPRDVQPLARVFPVLRRVEAVANAPFRAADMTDPQELRRRAFLALRELLARLGDRKPLVLAIDDLQWGDVDSARLLADLLCPPDPPTLLLLGCYRTEDRATSPFLQALFAAPEGRAAIVARDELAVDPLTPGEARDLALTLLGRGDRTTTARAEAIARESEGNPFFVHELVRHVHAEAEAEDAERAPTLDEVLWSRITRLPEDARRLLELAAVSGRPLRQRDACAAAALDVGAQGALAVLRSGRLVRSTGPGAHDEIEPYHDRVRETITARLAPEALADHHLRLARALETSGRTDPEVLAIHYQGANDPEKAGRYYAIAAAQAAEALAFDRAANLYRRTLALRPGAEADAEARRLRAALGDALANAGRGAEAAHEYLAAAADAGPEEALELRLRAARQLLMSGNIDTGTDVFHDVVKAVGLTPPSSDLRALASLLLGRARLRLRGLAFQERDESEVAREELRRIDVCWSYAVGFSFIDLVRGGDFATRHLLLALQAGEPSRIARGLAAEAVNVSASGGAAQRRAARMLAAAETLADRVGPPRATAMVWVSKAGAAMLDGRWKEALDHADRAERTLLSRCTDVARELDSARYIALLSLLPMGALAELARRRRALLRDAQERGDRFACMNYSTAVMVACRLGADEPEAAQHELQSSLELWNQRGFNFQHHNVFVGFVSIDLYRGDGLAAWERSASQWRHHVQALFNTTPYTRIEITQLHARCALAAAVSAADPRPFLRAAARDARQLQREKTPWATAHAWMTRAGVAWQTGDVAHAAQWFGDAAATFEAADMRLHAAVARRRWGELRGDDEGSVLIAKANDWMAGQDIRNPERMTALFAPGPAS